MPEPNWQTNADLNLDGQINAGDYTILRSYIIYLNIDMNLLIRWIY